MWTTCRDSDPIYLKLGTHFPHDLPPSQITIPYFCAHRYKQPLKTDNVCSPDVDVSILTVGLCSLCKYFTSLIDYYYFYPPCCTYNPEGVFKKLDMIISLCSLAGQTVMQKDSIEVLHQNRNTSVQEAGLSSLARVFRDPPSKVIEEVTSWCVKNTQGLPQLAQRCNGHRGPNISRLTPLKFIIIISISIIDEIVTVYC